MKVDYEVKTVTERIGSMDTLTDNQIKCPMCTSNHFSVFVHLIDYIDLVCLSCHALVHITGIEGK